MCLPRQHARGGAQHGAGELHVGQGGFLKRRLPSYRCTKRYYASFLLGSLRCFLVGFPPVIARSKWWSQRWLLEWGWTSRTFALWCISGCQRALRPLPSSNIISFMLSGQALVAMAFGSHWAVNCAVEPRMLLRSWLVATLYPLHDPKSVWCLLFLCRKPCKELHPRDRTLLSRWRAREVCGSRQPQGLQDMIIDCAVRLGASSFIWTSWPQHI